MATSPTQLSLKLMKDRGYLCQIVERWNSFAKVRQDLFGFIDVICVSDDGVIGVQTTSYSNMSARVKKIREHENFQKVYDSGIKTIVQGWHKVNNRWKCREVEVFPQVDTQDGYIDTEKGYDEAQV